MTDLPHVSDGDPHAPAHNAERDAINDLAEAMDSKISKPSGAATGDLLRWDGTAWVTTETRFFEGNGNPNGVVGAPVGSRYVDKLATLGVVEWLKAYGGEGNTGWVGGASDTGWLLVGATDNASFAAGWSNFGGSYGAVGYRLKDGIVHLKGLMVKVGTRAATAFVLPAGFRPATTMMVPAYVNGDVTSDQEIVYITDVGEVKGKATTAGQICLDTISFPAA